MLALKEFAHVITQNKADLAETYAHLLAGAKPQLARVPRINRVAAGRKLLEAVIQTLETGSNDPLRRLLFETEAGPGSSPSILDLTCLERTLTPIITNLEAGKFLWQILAELRADRPDAAFKPLEPETTNVARPEQPPAGKPPSSPKRSDEIDPAILTNHDKQLRTDSFYTVLLATITLAILSSIFLIFIRPVDTTADYLWAIVFMAVPPITGRWAWKIAQTGRQTEGAWLFIGPYLLLITIGFVRAESFNPAWFYLYGYFIMVSSTLIRPEAGFDVWLTCLVLQLAALFFRGQFLSTILMTAAPAGINLLMAIGGVLTTLDWREAVQSTALLHLRVQQRRDELFAAQEELRRVHIKQKALYTQLLTSVEVGQRIAALLDLDNLLNQVVDLIRAKLGFAYAGIFLLEGDHWLVAQAQAGNRPVAEESLPRLSIDDAHLLGLTARQRQDLINQDIRSGQFEAHPYLSANALSEIGLPLIVGDRLYGVLNIQSFGVNAFDGENLPIVRLLANQVSIALHNAELFHDAVLARKEAEQANEIKSHFLASMSHELRTPLNAILNFTGFVADGIFGPVTDQQVDALEKTLDSGAHLLSLINDILDLAKVEAGAMDMFVEEVDMKGLLRSTVATATGLTTNKPIKLLVEIAENLPPLPGDKRRLRQILLNLVSNAVKYTKEGQIKIVAQPDGDAIQICVQDTGIGIPAVEQPYVFESFHRAQNGMNSELGTGLGLPIAKHFVEAHGGHIWLESEVGVGTTFYVRLPLEFVRERYTISSAQRS